MVRSTSVNDVLPQVTDIGADGLAQRRRRALGEVLTEVGDTPGTGMEPVLALRTYGTGCVVLGLAGAFDQRGVERLNGLFRDLDRFATVELVVDLSLLVRCGPDMIRTLGTMRMGRLVAGTRIMIYNAPPELASQLGPAPAEAVTDRGPGGWTTDGAGRALSSTDPTSGR